MRTVKSTKAKLLVALIIFMIVFSNYGFTLSVIATSNEFQVITNGFFKKDEISFKAYFEDENGNEVKQITTNVNQKAKLILEILPQVQGYLRTADLKAVSADESDVNFKITNISYYEDQDSSLEVKQETNLQINDIELNNEEGGKTEEPETTEEPSVEPDTTVENEVIDTMIENEVTNTAENVTTNSIENVEAEDNTVVDELSGQSTISTNSVSGNSNTIGPNVVNEVSDNLENATTVSNDNTINDESEPSEERGPVEVITQTVEEPAISTEVENNEDVLIDEEKVIEEKTEEATEELLDLPFGMKIISDNEIEVMNIIKETKLVLDIEYEMGDILNVENLLKEIHLQLSGTYINSDLEDVPVAKEDVVTLGWDYTKDVELTSEYTKFSPFEVGDINGTIVENRITVKRDVSDEKFLPIKNTKLDIGVPKVNGKLPTEISIIGEKLLATRGEDTGYTNFSRDNWSYDPGTGRIQITVENTNLVYASGLDEYVIIYRYEDKIDAENSDLGKDVQLAVEEYSAGNNHIIEKNLKETQNIKVDVGELVTYSISSTEEKINKAKIYANYNNETPIYETEYTNQVNVNILTSDILEELKINCNQEVYKDENGFEFTAEGIEYRRIKFSFYEISTLLANGGDIVITNEAGEVLYTFNKDIIKSEEDCIINLNGETGIIIYARNIAKNGSLNFEVAKVIKGCNFDRAAFKNFTSIESRITAEVKYQKIEEPLALPAIGTAKYFEEASTYARLSLNKETLSTTKSNENVEIKIELNNDKENSNLYVNPAFEIVFPKYVNDVTIQNLNVLYENGLKVSAVDTFKEHDITKIKVELEGTQKTFSESSITNGTNIIINANIKVDEYTPKKEDQIKLYYCNEGVSTYESQTKWTISKQIPNGILKTTNGFDVAIIKYQAPSGLIAINGIVNYDGNLSEVKSVKQGEVKEQIETGGSSKIMTMELLALNNTDNKCSDVVLIGRIPFSGVKDVVTNKDLGTTVDTVMKDLIREDTLNTNTVDIYYSSNPDATKDLDNIGNGWSKEVGNVSEVRSFLIFVKGAMQPGQVLRYTYDFEIPANLPYETNIEGSFGAFYNNNSDIAVVYESSVADPVGLRTETGPKLTAELSADVEDGAQVLSNKRIKYTVKVTNEGSQVANDVKVNSEVPKYTNYVQRDNRTSVGDYGYLSSPTQNFEIYVGTLQPGEIKEVSYYLMTSNKPTLDQYAEKDENGYYIVVRLEDKEVQEEVVVDYEEIYDEEGNLIDEKEITETVTKIEKVPIKEYITEVPSIYITNKANVSTALFDNIIETNEIKNELVQSNFKSEIRIDYDRLMNAGMGTEFTLLLTNTSGRDLKNVVSCLNIGDIYEYKNGSVEENEENVQVNYEEGKIYFNIGDMSANQIVSMQTYLIAKKLEEYTKTVDCYFEYFADGISAEKSTIISQTVSKSFLTAKDMTLNLPKAINENDTITISTLITNISTSDCSESLLEVKIPDSLLMLGAEISGGSRISISNENNSYFINLPLIYAQQSITVDVKIKAKNMSGTEDINAVIERVLHNANQEDVNIDNIEISIKNTEKTDEEKELERIEKLKQEEEKNKQENLNNYNSTNSSNKTNNSSSNTNNSTNNTNNLNNSQNNTNNLNTSQNNTNKLNSTNKTGNETGNANTLDSATYYINGVSWLDLNKNGIRDDDETGLNGVKVYLLTTSNSMIKSTVTDKDGNYKFSEVKNGKYVVAVSYDAKKYMATTYKQAGVAEDKNSDILEKENGDITGLTNEINVENANVSNINIGLQNKNIFDLATYKYLSKIKVTNGKYEETFEYNNEEIAKVEIHSKRINGARVDLEYTIVVENTGDIDGYAENLVDYLDEDVQFDETKNSDWFLGNDGYVYAKNLNQTLLKKGEKIELKLALTKIMNEENTGTLSNRIELLNVYNSNNEKENTDNNISVQNTLILISTGNTTQIITITTILMIIAFIIYINKDNINISGKIFYKEKINGKIKIKAKKIYK